MCDCCLCLFGRCVVASITQSHLFIQKHIPILYSVLYVLFIIVPPIAEMIALYNSASVHEYINVITLSSLVLTIISMFSAWMMGYKYYCCFNHVWTQTKIYNVAEKVWFSSPLHCNSLISPGYLLYVGVPWFFVNFVNMCRLHNVIEQSDIDAYKVCIEPNINAHLWIAVYLPLLVYAPVFAAGSAYKNIIKNVKLQERRMIPPSQ